MKNNIMALFFLILCLIQISADENLVWTDALTKEYENLSVHEQVEIFATYFAHNYGIHPERGFQQAFWVLKKQTTSEAIPYLKYYFLRSSLEFDPSTPKVRPTRLKDVTIHNILFLIDTRVRISKNLSLETGLWFVEHVENKIMEYVTRYHRIDKEIVGLELFIQYIQKINPETNMIPKADQALFINADKAFWGKLLYEKYVLANELQIMDIGLSAEYVYSGYKERIIDE